MNFSSVLTLAISVLTSSLAAVLITALLNVRREKNYGKHRFLELCRRYVINSYNVFYPNTNHIKKDLLSYQLYVYELKRIVEDLNELLKNSYSEQLIAKYPRITLLMVSLFRELTEHEMSKEQQLSGLNLTSIDEVFRLHKVVLQDLGNKVPDNDVDQNIREIEKAFRPFINAGR